MDRTLLAGILGAVALIAVADALVLDDQPIDGVSKPSRWATTITPDPTYEPLMCATPANASWRNKLSCSGMATVSLGLSMRRAGSWTRLPAAIPILRQACSSDLGPSHALAQIDASSGEQLGAAALAIALGLV